MVNLLLDLHILEDEQNMLRQRIDSLTGGSMGSGGGGSSSPGARSNGSESKSTVDAFSDAKGMPESKLWSSGEHGSSASAAAMAESKDQSGTTGGTLCSPRLIPGQREEANAQHSNGLSADQEGDSKAEAKRAAVAAPADDDGNLSYLESLKQKHKKSLEVS